MSTGTRFPGATRRAEVQRVQRVRERDYAAAMLSTSTGTRCGHDLHLIAGYGRESPLLDPLLVRFRTGGQKRSRRRPSCETHQVIPGLDEIDWSELTCSYGSAEIVPELVEDVFTEQTEDAVGELWNAVLHQGTVYSSSAPIISILADIACAPELTYSVRVSLMELIVGVSRGRGFWQVHQGISIAGDPPDLEATLAEETGWVASCRQAAAAAAATVATVATELDDIEWELWPGFAACIASTIAPGSPVLTRIAAQAAERLDPLRSLCMQILCDLRDGLEMSPSTLDELHRLDPDFGGYEPGSDLYYAYLVESLIQRIAHG